MTLLDLLKVGIFVRGHTPERFQGFGGGGLKNILDYTLFFLLTCIIEHMVIISAPASDVPSYI